MTQREIDALRRIAARIAKKKGGCQAFGYAACTLGEAFEEAPGWLFEITKEDSQLLATVDIYSALWPNVTSAEFDPDKWTDMQLRLNGPITRETFQELSAVCRTLLAGRYAAITNPTGTHCMDLESGVTFIPRQDDGCPYPTPRSWEEFFGVAVSASNEFGNTDHA